ncbi:hypothetical protein SMACR_08760 [Sordaria macrospora]|uniref:WGS project CABT00000000 data, contig 2.65 n=2 Tax=Sordaria macrospora TaxID=5147 RepID=F7WAT2_SORMK|nr:uncharacterized protein SMAC_08760 [Sordaria macrospora k-hell]KAA8629286.1 hypothetical protein SMACR_08760 [Sordaria macrospora]WPJ67262.1 hypothetical protein SMAC4_08760 [Sordaria macrospora]CCC14247.1 unnamed protein product [Sordaria macrospora k-hell]
MSAIRLSASALRPVAARRVASPASRVVAFNQIRSVSSNRDELGGVQGSEPATRHNRYNVRAGTITAIGVLAAGGYMLYKKGDEKKTSPLSASQ